MEDIDFMYSSYSSLYDRFKRNNKGSMVMLTVYATTASKTWKTSGDN